SLRTFTSFYLSGPGLVAALAGLTLLAATLGEAQLALLILVAGFSFVFFYKIRIVPEHFWAARRFLAVVLPGALLMAGAAAFGEIPIEERGLFSKARFWSCARIAVGVLIVVVLGLRFWAGTRPLLRHVEYAGLIPHIEQIASTFGDDDLVLFE